MKRVLVFVLLLVVLCSLASAAMYKTAPVIRAPIVVEEPVVEDEPEPETIEEFKKMPAVAAGVPEQPADETLYTDVEDDHWETDWVTSQAGEGVADTPDYKGPSSRPHSIIDASGTDLDAEDMQIYDESRPLSTKDPSEGLSATDVALYDGYDRYGEGAEEEPTTLDIQEQNNATYLDADFNDSKVESYTQPDDKPSLITRIFSFFFKPSDQIEVSDKGPGDANWPPGEEPVKPPESYTHPVINDSKIETDLHEGEKTFWQRVFSWMSGAESGEHDLPEVDDEVELDTMSNLSQEDMLKLQMEMEKKDQAEKTLSNVLKSSGDTQEDIVRNLK